MSDKKFLEHLQSLMDDEDVPPLAENEFSTRTLMEIRNWPYSRAARAIAKWVREGKAVFVGERLSSQKKQVKGYKFV